MSSYLALALRRRQSIINLSSPLSLKSRFFFCTTATEQPPITAANPLEELPVSTVNPIESNQEPPISSIPNAAGEENLPTAAKPAPERKIWQRIPGKRRQKAPENIEDAVCRMIASRAWTDQLQNSIRELVPQFDQQLVCYVVRNVKDPVKAIQFFHWLDRSKLFYHNLETYRKIIMKLGAIGEIHQARKMFLQMRKKGLVWDEDLWVTMINSYGKAQIVQEGIKFFMMMAEFGVQRTIKSYDMLFKVILRRGRYGMAKRYYNKMLSEGIQPTVLTYNILINGFFLSEKVQTAEKFMEEMKQRGIVPNAVTYSTVINGYIRNKMPEKAEKCYVEMRDKKVEPDVITYNILIRGHVLGERIDDALRVLGEMKEIGLDPTANTYAKLLPGVCDAERMTEAKSILKEIVENRIEVDREIFTKLMIGQCKVGDLEAAVNVLKAMIRLRVPVEPGHYGILIENSCKAGDYDRGVKLLDKLIESELILNLENTFLLEPSAYNPMVEYLCKSGKTEKAETLLRQLMKLGVKDPIGLNNLVCGYSDEGAPDSAFEFLKIMVRAKVDLERRSYDSIIQSYLKKNEPAGAKAALDSMVENGHLPDSSQYRSVMESLFEDGRVQTASRVMKTMLEKGVKDHQDLIAKILEALFLRGHDEEALGRIELVMRSGVALNLDTLLFALSEKGKLAGAVKMLEFSLEKGYDIEFSSYEKVLDRLLADGKRLHAYSILCKIMGKGGFCDWSSCGDLIKSLKYEGNTREADILSRMIKEHGKKGKKKKAAATI